MTSTVHNRCLRFIRFLEKDNIRELPLQEVKVLFMNQIEVFDDKSLKAYFGQHKKTQTKKFHMSKIYYGTGDRKERDIILKTDLIPRRGYFEILDLAVIEQRGPNLFFILKPKKLTNELKVNFPSPSHSSFRRIVEGNID